MATMTIAVMQSCKPTTQPNTAARSLSNTVNRPIAVKLTISVGAPPPNEGGGMKANRSFHINVTTCSRYCKQALKKSKLRSFFVLENISHLL